ncbi:general stress protein [bacterium]|nr:MAG: general stress protein [bacterium]
MPDNNGEKARRNESIQKLWSMMKDIKVAMLTTAMKDGTLRSRPMMSQNVEFDGDLWFFTGKSTPKVNEIESSSQVNVSYANPKDNAFISLSGPVEFVEDRGIMQTFWNPEFEAWFPKGLKDPNLLLLKVHIEQAEYWDIPEGKMVGMFGFIKALATGDKPADVGENKKLVEKKGTLRPARATVRSTRRTTTKKPRKRVRSRR